MPHGDRSQVPLEPWLTDQWYCNAKILAQEPIKAVQDGRTKFVPKNWENTFFEWMKNISLGVSQGSFGGAIKYLLGLGPMDKFL